jgi:DNA-binding transcriptional ArsR family regulator
MRPKTRILTTEQLKCLASPIRNDVFTTLRSLKRASVGEIALSLGKSAETIHYHVRALEGANLIEQVAKRKTERRPEAIYSSTADTYRLPRPDENARAIELTRKATVTGLRRVTAGFEAAAKAAEDDPSLYGNLHNLRMTTRLKPEDIKALMDLLEGVAEFSAEHESEDGVRLVWSSVVYPVVPQN